MFCCCLCLQFWNNHFVNHTRNTFNSYVSIIPLYWPGMNSLQKSQTGTKRNCLAYLFRFLNVAILSLQICIFFPVPITVWVTLKKSIKCLSCRRKLVLYRRQIHHQVSTKPVHHFLKAKCRLKKQQDITSNCGFYKR